MSWNLLITFLTLMASLCDPTVGQSCSKIIPDAVTQLNNGTIVVFQDKQVWMFELQSKLLLGPYPISKLFEGMEGPVHAAVTIWEHPTITDFVGASVYFTAGGEFFTYKNLRPYQVEWGDIIYLPVKGLQADMGKGETAKLLMPSKMMAAFFVLESKIMGRSRFLFPGDRVLGFTFEMGSEFDKPDLSDMKETLKSYNVSQILSDEVTAAFTIMATKQVTIFFGDTFCNLYFDPEVIKQGQKCQKQPIVEFFDCENVNQNGKSSVSSAQFQNKGSDAAKSPKSADKKPTKGSAVGADYTSASTSTSAGLLVFYPVFASIIRTLHSTDYSIVDPFHS